VPKKRVFDTHSVQFRAVLQIFAKKDGASRFRGGGDDQRLVPGNAVPLADGESLLFNVIDD